MMDGTSDEVKVRSTRCKSLITGRERECGLEGIERESGKRREVSVHD
jgi:hypothetical protein